MTDLLPCPFCGGTDVTSYQSAGGTRAHCLSCNGKAPIAAWNTRSTPRAREGDGMAEIYRQGENGAIARRNELVCILKEIRELLGLPSSMPLEQIPAHVASVIAGRRVGAEGDDISVPREVVEICATYLEHDSGHSGHELAAKLRTRLHSTATQADGGTK